MTTANKMHITFIQGEFISVENNLSVLCDAVKDCKNMVAVTDLFHYVYDSYAKKFSIDIKSKFERIEATSFYINEINSGIKSIIANIPFTMRKSEMYKSLMIKYA